MKTLTYRGIRYESLPTQVSLDTDGVEGKYRGQNYLIKQALEVPCKPFANLKYRGIPYQGKMVNAPDYRVVAGQLESLLT